MRDEEANDVCLGQSRVELLLRRVCALVVAGVAAYASYRHQRAFALEGGADVVGAALWPLSVDGLLKSRRGGGTRVVAWVSFVCGVVVSMAANVASVPSLDWQPVLVAGWPPVALLLAVELLAYRPHAWDQFKPGEPGAQSVEDAPSNGSKPVAASDLLAAVMRVDEDHWSRWGEACVRGDGAEGIAYRSCEGECAYKDRSGHEPAGPG
jgi:hypothetical protein